MAEGEEPGSGVGPADDLSAVPRQGDKTQSLHIANLEKQHERYRSVTFWAGACLVVVFYAAFFLYVFADNGPTPARERYVVLIILAAIPTALAMSLMRYGFRNPIDQKDDSSPLTIIQAVGREVIEIVRSYFETKPR